MGNLFGRNAFEQREVDGEGGKVGHGAAPSAFGGKTN